ncbi:hypothetical protein BCR34DRAFT_45446 [Clohesyomyces aquaticus]|uniref:Uncharacterized protein n=1 Tax=Clohesyomyces aquaticus TaxID=1231657 RepID=A0A1Y1Z505_9PLEO|nr:hypothetical protein BCR34DRAFT_45446 [Clohesyomyces aquaticus]
MIDQNKKAKEQITTSKQEMVEKTREKIVEANALWTNELHRLTHEKDEKEKSLQTTTKELDATRDALQRSQQQHRNAESDLNNLRTEKAEIESRLRNFQQTVRDSVALSAELKSLKEQVRLGGSTLEAKESEISTFQQEQRTLREQVTASQESVDQHKTSLEAIGKHFETERAELQEKHRMALKEAEDKVMSLRKEKRDMELALEQARLSANSLLKDTRTEFALEKETLHKEIAELRSAKLQSKLELQHLRKEDVETEKRLGGALRTEIGELQRRLHESEATLKESQANVIRVESQKKRELELHKMKTAAKFSEISRRASMAVNNRCQDGVASGVTDSLGPQSSQQSSAEAPTFSQTSGTAAGDGVELQNARPKKKVNRMNNTVSSIIETQRSVHAVERQAAETQPDNHVEWSDNFHGVDPVLLDGPAVPGRFDENGLLLRERTGEMVPETQEESALSFGFDQFNERINQAGTKAGSPYKTSSSLSSYDSEVNDIMGREYVAESIPPINPSLSWSPRNRSVNFVTPDRLRQVPIYDMDPTERPRSQANTASRIAPSSAQAKNSQAAVSRRNPTFYDQRSPEVGGMSKLNRSHHNLSEANVKRGHKVSPRPIQTRQSQYSGHQMNPPVTANERVRDLSLDAKLALRRWLGRRHHQCILLPMSILHRGQRELRRTAIIPKAKCGHLSTQRLAPVIVSPRD